MANSITQLISLTYREEPLHSEVHEQMLCPLSGQVEPMRLQLYALHVNSYGIFKRIPRRPVARFFRVSDNMEIEQAHWTTEMVKAYETSVKGNTPVAGPRVRVTTYGKVLIIFLLIALAFLIYSAYQQGLIGAGEGATSMLSLL